MVIEKTLAVNLTKDILSKTKQDFEKNVIRGSKNNTFY